MADIKKISLRDRKFAETKISLLNSFIDKLNTKSMEDISVRELCESVPVSPVTFFNYFHNKNELLVYYTQLWSIEVEYYSARNISDPESGIEAIEYIFEYTAKIVEKNPNLICEIIALMAKRPEIIDYKEISIAEKITAFKDLEGIERVPSRPINELFADKIIKAARTGEMPADMDIEFLQFALISIFFGVPIGWAKIEPARIGKYYRKHLDLLWSGIGAKRRNNLNQKGKN